MAYLYTPWLLFTQILLQVSKYEAKVPAIIVFGDSSVDSGNNNRISTLLKSNFKPYGRDFAGGQPTGRFSNGRVPSDFVSEAFGLKPFVPAYLDPKYGISDFATGVCFASAGTGYDTATSDVLNVIPLWKEVEYYKEYQNRLRAYLGKAKAKKILTEALYLISLGTNDFLENYYTIPTRQMEFTVQQFEDFLIGLSENFIREIYSLGEHNNVAVEFNRKLSNMVAKLNQELPGLRILFTDKIYELFYQIIKRPSSYGFEVAEVACCATGTFEMSYLCNENNPYTCKDANKYVFWDAFHPTDKTNKILAASVTGILRETFK
ncbi:hypothetical protein CerSpe_122950 [Prunus speciosa]